MEILLIVIYLLSTFFECSLCDDPKNQNLQLTSDLSELSTFSR